MRVSSIYIIVNKENREEAIEKVKALDKYYYHGYQAMEQFVEHMKNNNDETSQESTNNQEGGSPIDAVPNVTQTKSNQRNPQQISALSLRSHRSHAEKDTSLMRRGKRTKAHVMVERAQHVVAKSVCAAHLLRVEASNAK